ncbi:MAG: methyltransferase domain-containing protein [Solirubrobacteraceae bacterium]|nr:methyltransferase domain-containing protein [Solirubrobacteraceae bacterium]
MTLACPACRTPLPPLEGDAVACPGCGTTYRRLPHGWDLTPPREVLTPGQWEVWEQLQRNGAVSYEEDPEHNLGVGDREDVRRFSRFARLHGDVLDVGCGPQPWPSYFDVHEPGTRFVGVDPLVGEREARYERHRALAEHLPFADDGFDVVLFAGTLDHFVDPAVALAEAVRVLRPGGTIAVYLGHKREGAPKPAVSHDWYEALEVPEGAEDRFHMERFGPDEAIALFARAGLDVVDQEDHRIDDWRSYHFYRLVPGAAGA